MKKGARNMKKWIKSHWWILLVMFVLLLPVVFVHWNLKAYNECMSWDGATEEECLPYLD